MVTWLVINKHYWIRSRMWTPYDSAIFEIAIIDMVVLGGIFGYIAILLWLKERGISK